VNYLSFLVYVLAKRMWAGVQGEECQAAVPTPKIKILKITHTT
jgi:hypothetical protein